MPELQTSDIHPEDLYVLDSCCEDDTIDAGTSITLRLYGDRNVIRDCVANTPVAIGPYPWRMNIGQRLMAYADQIIAELPASRRGEIVAASLIHLHHVRGSSAEYLACAAISDTVEGGWNKNYNRPARGWGHNRLHPFYKDNRRLHSPQWIRRYVKRDDEAHRLRVFSRGVLARARAVPDDLVRGDISSFDADFDAVRSRQRERDRLFRNAMAIGLSFEDAANLAHGNERSERALTQAIKKARGILKKRKRVLKRAARTAESVVGRDAVSSFARGERTVIMGSSAGFAVRARNMYANGHGALDIDVLSPEREKLGELCFYFHDTPALDQLTAIGLHCAAGAEADILQSANVTSITAAGAGHPLMRKEHPPGIMADARIIDAEPVEVQAPPGLVDLIQNRPDCPNVAVRNSLYITHTGHVWKEALGVHMLGPKYLKIAERLVGC